jgi:hypothetical protein
MSSKQKTSIYLVPYHSESGLHLAGATGQFAKVENAIVAGEWPYDNGDDPSFYVARRGGPLTWGVCRQDVRNSIQPGSIVVFFSYTSKGGEVQYRLSAVATVARLVDRRGVFEDSCFRKHLHSYLNLLIKPTDNGWCHAEDDREDHAKHPDWLWRIAVHGRKRKPFKTKYGRIHETGCFRDGDVRIAENYVVFSDEETYVAPDPPNVAKAIVERREHERWTDPKLQQLTASAAGERLASGRDYLRVANRSGRNVHRQIRFKIPFEEASRWRQSLISELRAREGRGMAGHSLQDPSLVSK